jgi:hypothetical protein
MLKKMISQRRKVAVPEPDAGAAPASTVAPPPTVAPKQGAVSWWIPVLFGTVAVVFGGFALQAYWQQQQEQTGPSGGRVYTPSELARFNGTVTGRKIMLAVLGEVFDVTAGKRFYAPPSHYAFFSGRDGSRVFVTGEFNGTGDIPSHHVTDLTDEQLLQVDDWRQQYHEKYTYMGVLHMPDADGYYDAAGQPTALLERIRARLAAGRDLAARQAEYLKQVPQCNA